MWMTENKDREAITKDARIERVNNESNSEKMKEELEKQQKLVISVIPAGQSKGDQCKRMTDDIMVRAAVLTTAINKMVSHAALIDEESIMANIH